MFWLVDIVFSTLTKNTWKKLKLKKNVKNIKNSSCASFVFDQKLFMILFL